MKRAGFTKREIVKETGLSPRLVQFYLDEDVVPPETHRGEGQGDHHLWSKQNVGEFLAIREMSDHGIKLPQLKKIVGYLNQMRYFEEPIPSGTSDSLIVYKTERESDLKITFHRDVDREYFEPLPEGTLWQPHQKTLAELLRGHRSAIIINLTALREEVNRG